jgi:hypothetical protein
VVGVSSPLPDRTTSRLTPADEDRIRATVARMAPEGWDDATIRRQAAHAVGCALYDLRDAEVAFIDRTLEEHR